MDYQHLEDLAEELAKTACRKLQADEADLENSLFDSFRETLMDMFGG